MNIGDIAQVNDFLGYKYSIKGKVVPGDRLGRRLGFPTANIRLMDDRKLLPALGVYAVEVNVDGTLYIGMLNIGMRPTVSSRGEMRIEVNIFDFEGDLYGHELRIFLLARMRGERKFDSIDELAAQLAKDRQSISDLIR